MRNRNLQYANFRSTKVSVVDFSAAQLQQSDLSYANLYQAILVSAQLQQSNMKGANLRQAHLRGATLSGADLSYAELVGSELQGAMLDQAIFDQHRQGGQFLEWAEVFDYRYGTLRAPIEEGLADGRLVILEIDVQGAIKVKQEMPDCHAFFILPPDEQTLLDRLRNRRRDGESEIQGRFSKAKQEIARARSSDVYGHFVVNDDLQEAIDESISWVRQQLSRY